ncbi:hypothetical protein [Kiritimatiella glycovorans]|uniref:hypothetical protein n=1 Tax=Kiritimatiella glycovorans TaxID=1307763 RepID=UPI00069A1541
MRGIKTVAEIAAENNVHPTIITRWKNELTEGAAELFERKKARIRKSAGWKRTATVSDEFKDPFSTAAGYGQLAGVVAEHSQEAGDLMLT